MIIAIDGPAGAGKSTIAKLLAQKLKFVYLDTGAMYRTIGLKAQENKIQIADEQQIENLINTTKISVSYENGAQKIFCDGLDVSDKIRQHFVSGLASQVSALKCVRLKMVELQRELAGKGNTILDGRDIGTYVLPNADYKFYLTASIDERADRRYKELCKKGMPCDLQTLKQDIAQRDYNDMNREFAPLKKAEDAIELDTTKLSIEEVVNKMLSIIK